MKQEAALQSTGVHHHFVLRHDNIFPIVFLFYFVCFLTTAWVFELSDMCRRALFMALKTTNKITELQLY